MAFYQPIHAPFTALISISEFGCSPVLNDKLLRDANRRRRRAETPTYGESGEATEEIRFGKSSMTIQKLVLSIDIGRNTSEMATDGVNYDSAIV